LTIYPRTLITFFITIVFMIAVVIYLSLLALIPLFFKDCVRMLFSLLDLLPLC